LREIGQLPQQRQKVRKRWASGPLSIPRLRLLGGGEGTQISGELLSGEGFDDVAFLEIAKAVDADTALHTVRNFLDVFLDALE